MSQNGFLIKIDYNNYFYSKIAFLSGIAFLQPRFFYSANYGLFSFGQINRNFLVLHGKFGN